METEVPTIARRTYSKTTDWFMLIKTLFYVLVFLDSVRY